MSLSAEHPVTTAATAIHVLVEFEVLGLDLRREALRVLDERGALDRQVYLFPLRWDLDVPSALGSPRSRPAASERD